MRHARVTGERGAPALVAVVLSVLFSLIVVNHGSAAPTKCADAVLRDWTAGTLVGDAYPSDCYQAAIDALPEDLRAYTTAADDIRHAQISATRVLAEAAAVPTGSDPPLADEAPTEDELRSVPSEVIFLGGLLVALAAAGGVAAIVRRHRGQ